MVDQETLKAVKKALDERPKRNFVETVELAINLKDVDLAVPSNRIDEEVQLPHGRGKAVRVGVFASGELAVRSKAVADLVIPPEEIEKIATDKRRAKQLAAQTDFFLSEAPLMPTIGRRLGVVLGPRGKMPKPIAPSADPKPIIETMRTTVRVRSRDKRTFHAAVGSTSMSPEQLAENVDAVLKRLSTRLARGRLNIHSVYVKTTMGKAERLL
ncbi:MAG TPA: 50S ribosomal protein L1 [Candidatus Thermoplasmatota archaeon]|nr:50S ribosomal protein L1 [Candidatus Thermoplasmatota archaeon]